MLLAGFTKSVNLFDGGGGQSFWYFLLLAVCKQEASQVVVLENYEELTSTWMFLTSGESECTVGVANNNTEQPLIGQVLSIVFTKSQYWEVYLDFRNL